MKILVYTYYGTPWELKYGDFVRIQTVCKTLRNFDILVIAYNLSHLTRKYSLLYKDGVVYVSVPRSFYKTLSKIIGWNNNDELNPLTKLTHYIDELIAAVKIRDNVEKTKILLIFGSMSLLSFVLRLLKTRGIIVYDPLSNYAQTLYLKSRRSLVDLLKYGLYLALHKLQLRSSDIVIYPSRVDLDNAKRMFKLTKTIIVPNPFPICYNNLDEYLSLRSKRKDFDKVYFVLLAGGRKINEEAVRTTIEIFNNLPPGKFKLIITGSWHDMKKFVRNPSIELVGVLPEEKLKDVLAMSDYGLSPIFKHAAGTFLKVLAYIASGLNIIASPHSLQGIDIPFIRDKKVIIVRNFDEYKKAIETAISLGPRTSSRRIITCRESNDQVKSYVKELIDYVNSVL